MDVTEEIPTGDGGEIPLEGDLPPEVRSFWRRRRGWIIAVVVVLLAGAGGLIYWLTSGSSTPSGLVISTTTVPVTTGTIQQTVASSGTIQPASQASLNFAVSGTVTQVNVKAGQAVTAGQVLATVNTTALTEDVSAAQAQLSLRPMSGWPVTRLPARPRARSIRIRPSVTSAESSLSNAQTTLNDAALTSTIAGTVASVDLNVGQQVTGTGSGSGGSGGNGTGSSATGSTGSSIGSDRQHRNEHRTDRGRRHRLLHRERDRGRHRDRPDRRRRPGRHRPTGSTTTVYGTVGSVSLIGSQTSNVTTFPVVIDVTGDPIGLYAGASADVSIIVKQLNNVTEVPTQAISYSERPSDRHPGRQRLPRREGGDGRCGGER